MNLLPILLFNMWLSKHWTHCWHAKLTIICGSDNSTPFEGFSYDLVLLYSNNWHHLCHSKLTLLDSFWITCDKRYNNLTSLQFARQKIITKFFLHLLVMPNSPWEIWRIHVHHACYYTHTKLGWTAVSESMLKVTLGHRHKWMECVLVSVLGRPCCSESSESLVTNVTTT